MKKGLVLGLIVILSILFFPKIEHTVCHTTFKNTQKAEDFINSLSGGDIDSITSVIDFDPQDDKEKFIDEISLFIDENDIDISILDSEIEKDDCLVIGKIFFEINVNGKSERVLFAFASYTSKVRPLAFVLMNQYGDDESSEIVSELNKILESFYRG